ncbi:hypothetical protein [Hyphobacterium sp.]|jgi:hypothetical protein
MTEDIKKTEARQGVRKRWQEHTLFLSLIAAIVLVGGGYLIFAALT